MIKKVLLCTTLILGFSISYATTTITYKVDSSKIRNITEEDGIDIEGNGQHIKISTTSNSGKYLTADISPPIGKTFEINKYTSAKRNANTLVAGLYANENHHYLEGKGSYIIHEISYNDDGKIETLSLDYSVLDEYHSFFASVRMNSDHPVDIES